MSIASSGTLGTDLLGVETVASRALGTRARFNYKDSDGKQRFCEAVYCQVNVALVQGEFVTLPDTFIVTTKAITTTLATSLNAQHKGRLAATAPTAFAVGEYGWLMVKGDIFVRDSGGALAVYTPLGISGTNAGRVQQSNMDYELVGIVIQETVVGAGVGVAHAVNDVFIKRTVA